MYLTFFVAFLLAVAGTLFSVARQESLTKNPPPSLGEQMMLWHSAAAQAAARDFSIGDTTTPEAITQTEIMTAPALLPATLSMSVSGTALAWQSVAYCQTPPCTGAGSTAQRIIVTFVPQPANAYTPVPNAGGFTFTQITKQLYDQATFGSAIGAASGADGARRVSATYNDGTGPVTVSYTVPDVVTVGAIALVTPVSGS